MMSRVTAAALHGIEAYPVTVEVDFRVGLPAFTIVGLPDAAVRESKERVISAIKNSGFDFPHQRITINLAPAHIKKEGPSFDFAIAIGILTAAGILPSDVLESYAFIAELGLDGTLRPVPGVLPAAMGLKKSGVQGLLVSVINQREAALVEGIGVYPIHSLSQAVRFLTKEEPVQSYLLNRQSIFEENRSYPVDFSDVKGQVFAKRALEIAAAGGHNVILIGPPGSGKTLLARRLPTIMPDMEFNEALETTKIHSVAGLLKRSDTFIATRPYRSPHHQISDVALIGGGSNPKPGEVSLAHRGVLFLDEFPEFSRSVLEALRQPLEDRFVTVARIANSVRYPSDFLLVAAANPCPCGYLGSTVRVCECTPLARSRYQNKFSGPLLDRIDMHVEVPALKIDEMTEYNIPSESSHAIRERVIRARGVQRCRLENQGLYENGQMNVKQIRQFCSLDPSSKEILKQAIKKLGLSARAYDRILRLARTIADLQGDEMIGTASVSEAIGYRILDRSPTPAYC